MLIYDAPLVYKTSGTTRTPHFLERPMIQSSRRHWFDQVYIIQIKSIKQKLAMLVAESFIKFLAFAKRGGYTATPETRYYGDSVKVGWVAGQSISATHRNWSCWKNIEMSCLVFFQNQFMLRSSIYYVKIYPKRIDLDSMNQRFFWIMIFQRVNRNTWAKWANFVACCIDQKFWPEARVHVVSFGDQDTEARISGSVSPSLTGRYWGVRNGDVS